MKAIQTRLIPVTNTKPDRIKAWAADNKPVTVSRYGLGDFPHEEAARNYQKKMNWGGELVTGYLPNGDYCHVPHFPEVSQ